MTYIATPLDRMSEEYDVVVVGSGYGGAISASRLARAGFKVCLLERGDERQPGDFPENFTGTFSFTGEGQTWTNSQNLKLTGSSNTLVRKQSDEAQPFTYKRCA